MDSKSNPWGHILADDIRFSNLPIDAVTVEEAPEEPADGGDDDMNVELGPFNDEDGYAIEGAEVEVEVDGETYKGTTDENGNVILSMPSDIVGEDMDITVIADGFEDVEYTTSIDDEGNVGTSPPPSKKAEDQGLDCFLAMGFIILMIVLIFVAGIYIRRHADEREDDVWEEAETVEASDIGAGDKGTAKE